jgi:nicotinamidase-related amidase
MAAHQPDIARSALLVVDMQNDFVHPDGGFSHLARERPEGKIDMPFLMGTIPQVRRLAEAFRKAGRHHRRHMGSTGNR